MLKGAGNIGVTAHVMSQSFARTTCRKFPIRDS
jgi:hypothetical protein